MDISHLAFGLFATFSALRIISYVPQIHKVAADRNGASAISYSTWSLWTAANIATALYAAVDLRDAYLASVSIIYAACCVIVIALTIFKRHRHHAAAVANSETPELFARPSRRRRSGVVFGSLFAILVGVGAALAFPSRIDERQDVTIAASGEAVNLAARDESSPPPLNFPIPPVEPARPAQPASVDRAPGTKQGGTRRRAAAETGRHVDAEWRQFARQYGIRLDE